jgi:hypothetical protein
MDDHTFDPKAAELRRFEVIAGTGRRRHWSAETIRAFTDLGIENLVQIVKIYKDNPDPMPRYPKAD